jgi:hypothetical protein
VAQIPLGWLMIRSGIKNKNQEKGEYYNHLQSMERGSLFSTNQYQGTQRALNTVHLVSVSKLGNYQSFSETENIRRLYVNSCPMLPYFLPS